MVKIPKFWKNLYTWNKDTRIKIKFVGLAMTITGSILLALVESEKAEHGVD